jgi:hypothetical protein
MAYATEQSVFYQTRSVVTVKPEFQVTFDCREGPRSSTVVRLVKMFEQTGSEIDNKKGIVVRDVCENA